MSDTVISSKAAPVRFENVSKVFGKDVVAVDNINLKVEAGKLVTLLGPSGCGKTTTLRMIAGLALPTSGEIFLDGEEIGQRPPSQRDIAFVFQMFALYPHMNVYRNLSYPLVSQGMPRAQVRAKVDEVATILGIKDILKKPVGGLSGGDRQRVARGRAIVREPKAFMMDEPLGALDQKLRVEMQHELLTLQRELGITFVFVTHDQEEALSMSDRIAVMSAGRLQQVGPAEEIYEAPRNRFVADFIGETNLFDADVISNNGSGLRVRIAGGLELEAAGDAPARRKTCVSIRPERIVLDANGGHPCIVDKLVYLGTDTHYHVRLSDGTPVVVRAQNGKGGHRPFGPGDSAAISVDPGAAQVLAE